jgi:uncharacterized protein (TIGR03083 family)
MATDHELVDMLDELWSSIDALGAELDDAAWKQLTECPGWSVQDNLVHLTALESFILGRPLPAHDVPDDLPHVRNDIGKANERWVESRRAWSGADALAEFHAVTRERIEALRHLEADDFGAESWTPMGPGTRRDLLGFRVFDCWVHEQDMRRAVGRPGDLDSAAAGHALTMMFDAMPYVIGKKVGPPDGSTVVFSLTGQLARVVAIGLEGRRARRLDAVPSSPTTTLSMTSETFTRLACGRIDPADAAGEVAIEGDVELGARVVEQMNYMF